MNEVDSHSVIAWKERSDGRDPEGIWPAKFLIGIYFLFFDVPAIIQMSLHVIKGDYDNNSNSTSVYLTETISVATSTSCREQPTSFLSWVALKADTFTTCREQPTSFLSPNPPLTTTVYQEEPLQSFFLRNWARSKLFSVRARQLSQFWRKGTSLSSIL